MRMPLLGPPSAAAWTLLVNPCISLQLICEAVGEGNLADLVRMPVGCWRRITNPRVIQRYEKVYTVHNTVVACCRASSLVNVAATDNEIEHRRLVCVPMQTHLCKQRVHTVGCLVSRSCHAQHPVVRAVGQAVCNEMHVRDTEHASKTAGQFEETVRLEVDSLAMLTQEGD